MNSRITVVMMIVPWVSLAAITLATAALIAPNNDGKRADEEDCKPQGGTKVFQTAQKYKLEYQSSFGQDCATYRVRNTPKGVLTPVEWFLKKNIYLSTNIPACQGECEWTEVTKPSEKRPIEAKTDLWYGINKDEFKEKAQAVRQPDPDEQEECSQEKQDEKSATPSGLRTRIKGPVADADGKALYVDLGLSSKLEEVSKVTYTFRLGEKSASIYLLPDPSGDQLSFKLESPYREWGDLLAETPKAKLLLNRDQRETVLTLRGSDPAVTKVKLVIMKGKSQVLATSTDVFLPKR